MTSITDLSHEIDLARHQPPSPRLARLFIARAQEQIRQEDVVAAQEDCVRAMGVGEQVNSHGEVVKARQLFDSLRGAGDLHHYLPTFKLIIDASSVQPRKTSLAQLKALRFCLYSYQAISELLHPTICELLTNLQYQVDRQLEQLEKPRWRRRWPFNLNKKRGYHAIANETGEPAEINLSRFQLSIFEGYGEPDPFDEPDIVGVTTITP